MVSVLRIIVLLAWVFAQVESKAVFAHFMTGNAENYTAQDWEKDISLAKKATIDAFALNMGMNDLHPDSLSKAFSTAKDQDFKLFFSFDYASNGSWPRERVTDLLKQYKDHSAYYQHKAQPFVSTFEGFDKASDWKSIKKETDCFFVPDWSAVEPHKAARHSVVDGLFNWNAWPEGPRAINTTVDEDFLDALDGRSYMMPVSPWFYTNLPGFDKNWVWRGDNLWHDRWQQVFQLQPDFVQINTWNDFGESHYIGPLNDARSVVFGPEKGDAPFDYARNMEHDGWRTLLPYLVSQYKSPENKTTLAIAEETVVSWYRLHPGKACRAGGTRGNAPDHRQKEYPASEILEDRIFYSALLNANANVSVKVGDDPSTARWEYVPENGKGIYHGSVPFQSTGRVEVAVTRQGKKVAIMQGEPITSKCSDRDKGLQNWNAWVGQSGSATISEQGLNQRRGTSGMSEYMDCVGL
ncbi:glycoside hydrolase [Aspergillus campestris IBT 28561]|uniref:Glycoside hydrolase n=1 Tax=Aspergillus campestris (strain IBT 28561) TaxID=1392248 RepID=A0A2I1D937_ASPC2|nr:glycoside hydrolase [Aspergillus campestris IBT 28561]PKY06393.1 glycoside hydrolase [Aspergillus campestris IBT 28561]